MNDREAAVVDFIDDFWEQNSYGPSTREVAQFLCVRSTSTAHLVIHRLIKQGIVCRAPGAYRSLRVV